MPESRDLSELDAELAEAQITGTDLSELDAELAEARKERDRPSFDILDASLPVNGHPDEQPELKEYPVTKGATAPRWFNYFGMWQSPRRRGRIAISDAAKRVADSTTYLTRKLFEIGNYDVGKPLRWTLIGAVTIVASYSGVDYVGSRIRDNRPAAYSEKTPSAMPTTAPAQTPAPKAAEDRTVKYVVKKGDTLWDISARKLGDPLKYRGIKRTNGLTGDTIYPGQKLDIFMAGGRQRVKVKKDDTLSGIAHETTGDAANWPRIWESNKGEIPDPDLIFSGQNINIPEIETPKTGRPDTVAMPPYLETFDADLATSYMNGLSAKKLGKTLGKGTDEVYRMLNNTRKSGVTYQWSRGRHMAEATGEAGYIQKLVNDYRKDGLSYRAIAGKIEKDTGFRISANTVSRMRKRNA